MNHPAVFVDRLNRLAAQLAQSGVHIYLQPVGDEFQGEYVPASAARLAYVSGFSGSAGLGVFWAQEGGAHALFTDGRYTIQAADELRDTGIQPINSGEQSLVQWLAQHKQAKRIGFDPWLVTHSQIEAWRKATAASGVEWVALPANPVDAVWGAERPALPAGEVQLHPLALAGQSYHEKREALLAKLREQPADGMMLTLPDGINWLLNIRGSDIPFNPLLLSYFMLRANGSATLYCFDRTFDQSVANYLSDNNVKIESIRKIFSGEKLLDGGALLAIDPAVSAHGFWQLAQAQGWQCMAAEDATLLPKACKNAVELEGMRTAHRRDGLALARFLSLFDTQVSGGRFPEELQVVDVLEQCRSHDPLYRGPSFATIAGSGPNGAVVHYRATPTSNRRVRKGELFLLDSGGQYDDGTTDVTRTLAVHVPNDRMREDFTRVLRGHIALAMAVFPEGTTGAQLDVLARQFLWQAGRDYDHGTGHGVGSYLCVHEGPQRISKRSSAVALQPGMILSNEPGYYVAGHYGIRIENLVAVLEVGQMADGKKMLGFETLTLAPIDTRLVQVSMLTSAERNWLNHYHQQVYRAHAPALQGRELAWLEQATQAV